MRMVRLRRKCKCFLLIATMLVSTLYIYPHIHMDYVRAASYTAATEYDGIGADKISNCVAFARYKVPSLPSGLYSMQDKINIINSHTPEAGVIAITSGNSSYGHVAYVESVSGGTVVTLNGGFSGSGLDGHIVRIAGTESEQGIVGYWKPNGSNPTPSVYYSRISLEFVDNWNAGLYGRIENPNRSKVEGVGVHIWDSDGKLVVDHTEGCNLATSYVEQRLNVVSEALPTGLRSGETYTYEMFARVNGTNIMSSRGSFTCTDSWKPEITDVKVYDVDEDGYTVSCKAVDNYKVDRVQFPTWTLADGQDDLAKDWWDNPSCNGEKDGNTYTFRVKRSDHNNEFGTYRTHIYAWDKAGNSVSVEVNDQELKPSSGDAPELKDGSAFTISGDQMLTGLVQGANTVREAVQQFTTPNLVCKDANGNVLGEDDLLGTGATVSVMDGTTVKASCQVVLAGDVNGDGKVNGKDVSMLARSLVGKATLTDAQKEAGEVFEDGKINGKDVSKLAQSLVGKATIPSQGK